MAGNRGIYNAAIKRAQEHTRKQEWSAALREYQRAAAEFPEDVAALMGIAAAYTGLKRWRDALELYQELQRAHPDDLVILEHLAEVQVQLKDLSKARELYLRLGDQYVVRRKMAQAIATLERLSELFPADEEVMNRLARLYQDAGDRNAAVRVQVERVRLLFREGRLNEAMALCEETLQVAPDNRQAKELLFRLRREMAARKERGEAEEKVGPGVVVSAYQMEEWAREAAERQERGDVESALRLYERAVQAGLNRPDVCYSLGLLYKEAGRLAEAVEQFRAASRDDEFALSSHYAMGECYRELGQLDLAAQELERALHLVDLPSIGREAVEDLVQMYEAAANVHEQLGDLARAASLYATLAGFLQSKRWKHDRTEELRQRAQELTEKSMFAKLRQLGTGILPAIEEHARGEPTRALPGEMAGPERAIPSLTGDALRPITDFLRAGGRPAEPVAESTVVVKPLEEALSIAPPVPLQLPVRELDTSGLEEPVRELVQASRVYLEKGLFNAAVDACCEVIDLAPDYLPIHLRLAEVYERQDRPELALEKYQTLAETYLARQEKDRAIEVYQALLALSPDAVAARKRLADLLTELGRLSEAAHQLVQMAQTYSRIGQTGRAVEVFREVRALAPENKDVYLEYGLFLLKMDKPEAAIGELRRALQLDPQDPLALVRVNVALALQGDEQSFQQSLATVLKRAEESAEAARALEQEYRDTLLFHESPLIYYALGMLQRQAGRVGEAIDSLQRALRAFDPSARSPLQLQLCRVLAEGYLLSERPDDAIQVLQQGLEWAQALAPAAPPSVAPDQAAVPTPLSFHHWLAEAYTKAGRLDQAIAALSQAKGTYPHDRETGTKLADLYFRQGNLRQALAELTELVVHYEQANQLDYALDILQYMARLAPSNLAVHRRLSHLYIRRGYVDKGLEELDTLSGLAHKRGQIEEAVRALQEMAEVYWTMGRQDRAYQVYDRIVQMAPDDVAARQQLVNLHILAGRLADALEEQRHIARIALRRQDTETSVAALHQVLALDPQDHWALRQLSDLLAAIGEHGQSLRLYRRLARLEPDNPEIAMRIQEEERLTGTLPEASG